MLLLILQSIDNIQLPDVENALVPLNISLFVIMFGVALGIKLVDFKRILAIPKPAILGIISQFILLPLFTFLLVYFWQPTASIGLGMILVAACPGGNISNFMTSMAKGNAALSVTLTAFATLSAVILTPFNFQLYGSLFAPDLMQSINVDPLAMFKTVALILAIPLLLGMLFSHYLPKITAIIVKPIQYLSILIFLGIVILAFVKNWDNFISCIHLIFILVLLHNLLALTCGFSLAKLFQLNLADTKTLSIETGIQNSGLALILYFNFFSDASISGMGVIAAWWGIWHIVSGLTIATLWSRKS